MNDRGRATGLRFCMVTTFYPPANFGGDGISTQRLARALARRGHHVTVLHDLDAYRALAGRAAPGPEPDPDGVEVVTLRSRLGRLSPSLTHQLGRPTAHARALQRLLGNGRFDVIHFHNVSLIGGPGILAYGDAVKLYTATEHWLVCPTHVLWRHDREPCSSRECLRCVLRHRRPPQLWRYGGYLRRQLHHVDVFIAKSRFSRDKHRALGFPREMQVVPNFLPDTAPPSDGPSPHARPYFLFAGRLEAIKGLEDVIDAFRGIRGADLLIAGEGSQGAALRRRAADADNVKFVGRLDEIDLDRHYMHAVAAIAPSAGFETFGLVVIEAFRRSTPVIARELGSFPELIRESQAGLLFRTPDDLRAAVQRLLDSPSERARRSARARRAFVQRWSEERVLPRYLDVVGGAIARKGRMNLLPKLAVAAA